MSEKIQLPSQTDSSDLSLGLRPGISFPPRNYLTYRSSTKSSKSFWLFFSISSKC